MLDDYVFLAVVAIVGFGGAFYLLAQAMKYRRTHDQLNEGPKNLTPPRGYQSWLHYAVETMETRSLELEGIFDEWPDHAGKAVSREEMRAAAQRELFQVLKGSVLKYE